MESLKIACPAATLLEPPQDAASILCGVLAISNEGASIDGYAERGQVNPVFSGRKDAGTVHGFCAGQGIPGSRASYCSCEIWRAEKRRIDAARKAGPDGLIDIAATRPVDSRPTRPGVADHVGQL